MRAIDCPCGHHLDGANDEELFHLARANLCRPSKALVWWERRTDRKKGIPT